MLEFPSTHVNSGREACICYFSAGPAGPGICGVYWSMNLAKLSTFLKIRWVVNEKDIPHDIWPPQL